jgi:translocation and assembly module TamB
LGFSLAGRGDIDLRLDGSGSLAAAKIAGTVQAQGGQLEGIPFAAMTAGFHRTGGCLTADYITMNFPGSGVLTARGTADNGRLNMTFFGQGIPLTVLAARTGGLNLAGTVDAEGAVDGTTDAPRATFRFTAYNGQALQQPFSVAKGGLTLTRTAVTLDAVEAVSGVTRHTLSGSVGLTGGRELNLTVVTRQARAENLIKLIMPGERLTGNIDNEVTITGPMAAYTAEGRVKLSEGSFRGQLIARAEGSYRRAGGATELHDFVVNSLNAELRFDGRISADNRLDLKVTAKDIDLAAVHINFPYPVAGRANFAGQLTGTLSAPVFSGEVAAASLKLNGQILSDITGQISVDGDQLVVPAFGFSQGEGKFSFAGGIGVDGGTLHGNLAARNGNVAGLLALFNIQAKDIDGRLDGDVTIGGTVARPDIWLTGTLTKGKIKNYPLDTIEADIALRNNVVTINRFYAKQGDGVLAARGTATLGGPMDMEISGRDIDAGLLTAWLDTTATFRGKLTFTAQVTGATYSPHAAVSLEISGGGVANATFDAMYGLFVLDKGNINVNQLMVTKGPHRASAYGNVPLAALNREGRARAPSPITWTSGPSEQADLSILPLLTGEVAWATGETKGEITIGGTLAQPLLNGSVVVKDGTVKLKALAEPIQKVGVDIQFEDDKINVIAFDGSMGGGAYRLTGTAALKGLALADYRMLLVLDKLGINHKYFKGPLQGTFTLDSNGGKPVLSGSLVFNNTTINVPFVPEFEPTGLDIGLDIEVVAAKKVRLMNPYLYDLIVEGKAKFTGTTMSPSASGRFTAVRGTVNYLRTQFRVDNATADFNQFASLLPVIRLTAETKLEYTRIKLAVNGPPDALEIHLSSEPSMSQQQILSLLTLRNRYADRQSTGGGSVDSGLGRDELIGLLDAGLQMTFIAEAESAFRNSFGLDEFRLVRSNLTTDATPRTSGSRTAGNLSGSRSSSAASDDRQLYNVEIGKYITDRLYLSYTVGIDHRETSAFFRYDINRRLSLTGAIDEYNRRRVGVEARFTF